MMRALLQHHYGSATEVLRIGDVALPRIGDDEVLVKVHAVGIGPHVWHSVTGVPIIFVRLTGGGARAPKAHIPRSDIAGVVEAVGARVTRFLPGDEVYGMSPAAFADLAPAKADELAIKPANLSFQEAAAVPVSACAALHALRDVGHVSAGQHVLILGASGGVGTFAVQIAKAYGAEVTGVCSGANAPLVTSLGADRVIDYTTDDPLDGRQRYELIVDLAGRRPVHHLRRALAPRGTLVVVGGEGGGRWTGGFGRALLRAPLRSLFTHQRMRPLVSSERHEDLVTLTGLIEAGLVRPVVSATCSLDEAPSALTDEREGHGRGKVVTVLCEGDDEDEPAAMASSMASSMASTALVHAG